VWFQTYDMEFGCDSCLLIGREEVLFLALIGRERV